jgi:hypothetical protein
VRALLEFVLGALDIGSILLRKRPTGLRWDSGEPPLERMELPASVSRAKVPRIFTLQLYYAHLNGASSEDLSRQIQAPIDWVEERLEAARECVELDCPPIHEPARRTPRE